MFPNKEIVDNAVNSADHTTLVAAVKGAGRVNTLKGPGSSRQTGPDVVLVCEDVYRRAHYMSETLSIRIDAGTKKRLDELSKRSMRSKSFLAAEAIAAYVESQEWQLGEFHAGIVELDSGQEVGHDKVSKWLKSWGKAGETKAPK